MFDPTQLTDNELLGMWDALSEWVETASEFIGDDGPGVHETFDKYLPTNELMMGACHDEAVNRGLDING